MGLPGAGKTTLSKELCPLLKAVHFDGDDVRINVNKELTFSEQDRIENARRIGWMCDKVVAAGHFAIASFVCPTEATRAAFGPCYLIWLNTILTSRYWDTNAIFEKPEGADLIITLPRKSPSECAREIWLATKDLNLD